MAEHQAPHFSQDTAKERSLMGSSFCAGISQVL